MTPEQRAHKAVQREMGGLWDYQRHEDRYSPDIPDISFAYEGQHGWIELKSAELGEVIKLRPGQINWLVRRGGHGFLIIRSTLKGKHLGWVGVRNDELHLLRHQQHMTIDTILGLVPNPILAVTFGRALREALGLQVG